MPGARPPRGALLPVARPALPLQPALRGQQRTFAANRAAAAHFAVARHAKPTGATTPTVRAAPPAARRRDGALLPLPAACPRLRTSRARFACGLRHDLLIVALRFRPSADRLP